MAAFDGTGHFYSGCWNVQHCPICYTKIVWNNSSGINYEPCECNKPKPKIKKIGKSKYF